MKIQSGDRVEVTYKGKKTHAFALQDADTAADENINVRLIGKVGTPGEIGPVVDVPTSGINLVNEPQLEEK